MAFMFKLETRDGTPDAHLSFGDDFRSSFDGAH
jgi:hypothetical protein